MDVFDKYIIYDNELIIGRVTYHKELLPDDFDKRKVLGGGSWRNDKVKKIVCFFGESYDFGEATVENFQKALSNSFLCGYSDAKRFFKDGYVIKFSKYNEDTMFDLDGNIL